MARRLPERERAIAQAITSILCGDDSAVDELREAVFGNAEFVSDAAFMAEGYWLSKDMGVVVPDEERGTTLIWVGCTDDIDEWPDFPTPEEI